MWAWIIICALCGVIGFIAGGAVKKHKMLCRRGYKKPRKAKGG